MAPQRHTQRGYHLLRTTVMARAAPVVAMILAVVVFFSVIVRRLLGWLVRTPDRYLCGTEDKGR